MPKFLILFVIILTSLFDSETIAAEAVAKFNNFQSARTVFWDKVVPLGGSTIYCGNAFEDFSYRDQLNRALTVEQVYPMSWAIRYLGCINRSTCRTSDKNFQQIEADLHNFYPARRDANQKRMDYAFGVVSGNEVSLQDCVLKVDRDNNIVQPAMNVVGEIARSLLYMNLEYGLPIHTNNITYEQLIQWHASDPPDRAERERNATITKITGVENVIISYPEVVNNLYAGEKMRACSGEYADGKRPDARTLKDILFFYDQRPSRRNRPNLQLNELSLCGANLSGVDLSGLHLAGIDLSYTNLSNANFSDAYFNRVNLTGANLNNADLTGVRIKRSNLSFARMRNTNLTSAQLYASNLSNVLLDHVVGEKAILDYADISGSWVIDSNLKGSSMRYLTSNNAKFINSSLMLVNAEESRFDGSIFSSSSLVKTNFSRSQLIGSVITGSVIDYTNFQDANVASLIFEPADNSNVSGQLMASAINLHQLSYDTTPLYLHHLRGYFKNAGLRSQERAITYAVEKERTKRKTGMDRLFWYVLFELTSDYGYSYGRPLKIMGVLILVFGAVYFIGCFFSSKDLLQKVIPATETNSEQIESINTNLGRLFVYSIYFSTLSAFHIGWRELNVGSWLVRMQPKEFVVRANSWLRTVSGLQSIISVYLLALWVLTYFGRPFE